MQSRKTFKYRLYSSKNDKHLHQMIDASGDIWNHCIALHRRYYRMFGKHLHKYRLQKHIAKLRNKSSYWKLVDAQSVQVITERIDNSYMAFFKWCKNKKGIKKRPPRFKKKKNFKSFTLKQNGWKYPDIHRNRVRICKKWYKFCFNRFIQGDIRTVTIKRDNLGKLWICFSVKMEIVEPSDVAVDFSESNVCGLDFGLKTFITTNHGDFIESPEYLKQSLSELKRLSKKFSKKKRGSKNWHKAKNELNRLYIKISNQRRDWLFKLANNLLSKYDLICIEDLDLESMKKRWGRKISDVSYSEFVIILKYLAKDQGKHVITIDRYYPSSQMCSSCGKIKEDLKLSDRTYNCSCGLSLDRDENAAKNILRQGIVSCGADVRPA